MKKFTLFLSLLVFLYPAYAFAQEPSLAMTISPTPNLTPTIVPVNYTLPYPGILADNPLYVLKTLRDNIIGWLINDPLKKANFDLLQSDKRLQIGVYLLRESKTKTPLAVSTISKGENYLTEAVSKVNQAKKQGESATDTIQTLHTAILKHEEVIKMLENQVTNNQKPELNLMYTHEVQLEQQLPGGK